MSKETFKSIFSAEKNHLNAALSNSVDEVVLKAEAKKYLIDFLLGYKITIQEAKDLGLVEMTQKWVAERLAENIANKPPSAVIYEELTPIELSSLPAELLEGLKPFDELHLYLESLRNRKLGIDPDQLELLAGMIKDKFENAPKTKVMGLVMNLFLTGTIAPSLRDKIKAYVDGVIDRANAFLHPPEISPSVAPVATKSALDIEVENWLKSEDTRPPERKAWTPWDYIAEAVRQIKPPGVAMLKDSVDLRGEFNNLVEHHPVYKKDETYWKTAMASWNVLYNADPPSGGKDFTIDFAKWKEKNFQQSGYDVEHVGNILKHEKVGGVAMRILALLEVIMQDDTFSVPGICEPGQFVARNMDKRSPDLQEAIKEIVKKEKWLENAGIPEEMHLVDAVYNIANSLDMRGHFFLDDTAAAVTKGFGGEDYGWLCRPESTIGYDINRYAREPKASWYLVAAVDIPDAWHERVTFNEIVSVKSKKIFKNNVYEGEIVAFDFKEGKKQLVLDYYEKTRNGTKAQFDALDWKNKYEIITEYIKLGGAASARIENGKKQMELVRDWFHILVSENDVKQCMEQAVKRSLTDEGEIDLRDDIPFDETELQKGNYVFRDRGSTFPTIYQYYISQMLSADKKSPLYSNEGKIASAGLSGEDILNPSFDAKLRYQIKNTANNKAETGFNTYLVAQGGWLKVLDMIKAEPKPVDGDALLRNIDNFLAEIGKAKVVHGAHHNLFNTMAFLFLAKQFKFLEPRNYSEFKRIRNLALDKVQDQDTSKSGGGVPGHVKTFMTWILKDAKSLDRSDDKPGDLLRPMDPSLGELAHDKIHDATRGMDEKEWTTTWITFWAGVEAVMGGLDTSKGDEKSKAGTAIPLGHIKWEDQDTSTKAK